MDGTELDERGSDPIAALCRGARVLVAGAGGFIGGHLARRLSTYPVDHLRVADIRPCDRWEQRVDGAEEVVADLRDRGACADATAGIDLVFNLAADMGGMGYIESHKAACMFSVLINTHLLMESVHAGVERYFFSSSACVYNVERQAVAGATPLRESDAYPAMPEDGYGWEKLFGEHMCRHVAEDFGVQVRVARYHNVYGPLGAWRGERAKAPAAICRKVAEAALDGRRQLEVWGDGEQTRSFTFVDDCVEGTLLLMASDYSEPLNIGSDEAVSINELVNVVESLAGVSLERRYLHDAPLGVRGRSSDNTTIESVLAWKPTTPLWEGLRATYAWIAEEVRRNR